MLVWPQKLSKQRQHDTQFKAHVNKFRWSYETKHETIQRKRVEIQLNLLKMCHRYNILTATLLDEKFPNNCIPSVAYLTNVDMKEITISLKVLSWLPESEN